MAIKTTKDDPKVDYKSKKADIWNAYKELLGSLEKDPAKPKTVVKLEATTNTLKSNLTTAAESLHNNLIQEINSLSIKFEQATQVLSEMQQLRVNQETLLKEQEAEIKKMRQRESEEYEYELEKRRKHQEENLDNTKKQVFSEINERKAKIEEQEGELVDLRNQTKTFEARIEKSTKDAEEKVSNSLAKDFGHEKALASQKSQAVQELLELKVKELTKRAEELNKENSRLHQEINNANSQLTRIAERAVEKAPTRSTDTKESAK